MCGIAGVLRIHQPEDGPPRHHLESIPERWLDILDDSIKHRGPDGQGRFRDRAVRDDGVTVDIAFVHRRLSIIDHAGGHQPMVHDGDRLRVDLTYQPGEEPKLAHELEPDARDLVAVVFNGCIYNHRDLRTELESKGAKFGSDHSDTEVLVHGWRAWEMFAQERLDGMYAAMIWDRRTGQAAGCRDFAGEKPLYHCETANSHLFSSETTGMSTLLGARRESLLHLRAIEFWLQFGCDYIPATPASTDAPAKWSVIPGAPTRGGTVGPPSLDNRYRAAVRSRPLPSPEPSKPADVARQEIEAALLDSVRSRLDADVQLGVFLSGGIDSSLVAAIARQTRADLKTFTVRMPDPRLDESGPAERTAAALGTHHTTLDCDPRPAEDLKMLIEQLGQPFGDSSLLPTYWVSKAAREHVKVALSGDGGDELFGGYRRHVIYPALHKWRATLRLIPRRLLGQRNPTSPTTYLARLAIAARYGGYPDLLSIFPTPDLRKLAPTIDGDPIGEGGFTTVENPLRYDFVFYLAEDLLLKTDTASMAVALEVRAPFLSKDLIDAAMRAPLDILMPNGERKGLLKQVARRYLPDEIINRPKQGFAIPIGDWFRTDYGNMRQLLYDHLESADPFPGLAEAGVDINMNFVNRMLREHDAAGERSINPWHGRDHAQRLYMLLVLSIWAKWLASLTADHRTDQ